MVSDKYLDELFTQGAQQKLEASHGKIFSYAYLSEDYQVLEKGQCVMVDRMYDPGIDCDVLTIKDITTGKVIVANQFRIDLKAA